MDGKRLTVAEAEQMALDWAANYARRDEMVRTVKAAGLSKLRIHKLTGIARTTIDRILEETAMTDPISEHIQAYITERAIDLSGHNWYTAAWGKIGPQSPATMRDITGRLYTAVRIDALTIANDTGREIGDSSVLAEIDMDAAWTAAHASHLVDRADEQIAMLREEEVSSTRAHEDGLTEWPGQNHGSPIAHWLEIRASAAEYAIDGLTATA